MSHHRLFIAHPEGSDRDEICHAFELDGFSVECTDDCQALTGALRDAKHRAFLVFPGLRKGDGFDAIEREQETVLQSRSTSSVFVFSDEVEKELADKLKQWGVAAVFKTRLAAGDVLALVTAALFKRHRVAGRHDLSITGTVVLDGKKLEATICDLSSTGIGLTVVGSYPETSGKVLQVSFSINREIFAAKATLRRIAINKVKNRTVTRMGLKIQHTVESTETVARILDTHRKRGTQRRVSMSKLAVRRAKQFRKVRETSAALTTFNEVDMSAFLSLKQEEAVAFEETFGVKLSLVPIAASAVAQTIANFPILNAEIRHESIHFRDEVAINVALHTDRGLAAPVLADCSRPLHILCTEYAELVRRAREGLLTARDYVGGTFSVTNGGVFGSLFSTPLLNARQVGILGLHSIHERAVVVHGDVVARPMMFVALTYDHQIVEGRDAIRFLAEIKNLLEQPSVLLNSDLR